MSDQEPQPVRIVGIGHGKKHGPALPPPTAEESRFANLACLGVLGVLVVLGLIFKGITMLPSPVPEVLGSMAIALVCTVAVITGWRRGNGR